MGMSTADAEYVRDVIECEGFDYGMRTYLSPERVADARFRELHARYCAAADELERYIGEGTEGG